MKNKDLKLKDLLEKYKNSVISVVGAGGKTSLILYAAGLAKQTKRAAVVLTTTRMYQPDGKWYREGQIDKIREDLEAGKVVWAGEPAEEERKIKGVSKAFWKEILKAAKESGAWVFVEADGAKHFPCKVPAAHEPVIPEETRLVIGVAGLDCLGRPLAEVCFRPELAARLLGTSPEHIMTEEDLAAILTSPAGTKKGVFSGADYAILLNKCDLPGAGEKGEKVRELLWERGCEWVLLDSLIPGLVKEEIENEGVD